MWFNPVPDVNKCAEDLYIKAVNITKVVSLNKDTGFDWLESLLKNVKKFFSRFLTDVMNSYWCKLWSHVEVLTLLRNET